MRVEMGERGDICETLVLIAQKRPVTSEELHAPLFLHPDLESLNAYAHVCAIMPTFMNARIHVCERVEMEGCEGIGNLVLELFPT